MDDNLTHRSVGAAEGYGTYTVAEIAEARKPLLLSFRRAKGPSMYVCMQIIKFLCKKLFNE
jgi:hypothetical protein